MQDTRHELVPRLVVVSYMGEVCPDLSFLWVHTGDTLYVYKRSPRRDFLQKIMQLPLRLEQRVLQLPHVLDVFSHHQTP